MGGSLYTLCRSRLGRWRDRTVCVSCRGRMSAFGSAFPLLLLRATVAGLVCTHLPTFSHATTYMCS